MSNDLTKASHCAAKPHVGIKKPTRLLPFGNKEGRLTNKNRFAMLKMKGVERNARGGLLRTTKENAAHHGVGVKSISRIVKKYGGQFGWSWDEDKKSSPPV